MSTVHAQMDGTPTILPNRLVSNQIMFLSYSNSFKVHLISSLCFNPILCPLCFPILLFVLFQCLIAMAGREEFMGWGRWDDDVLSYPILSYPILSFLILSFLILSFLILSYPNLPHHILFCSILYTYILSPYPSILYLRCNTTCHRHHRDMESYNWITTSRYRWWWRNNHQSSAIHNNNLLVFSMTNTVILVCDNKQSFTMSQSHITNFITAIPLWNHQIFKNWIFSVTG